jgi:response regulator NasT
MKVLLVDENAERAEVIRDGLRFGGLDVAASISSPAALLRAIDEIAPDVIVIDTESPSRDVLEHLVVMSQHTPRAVVMFSNDGAPETIRQAVRAGVTAYVVDSLDRGRVATVVEAALASFGEMQSLRAQLAEANFKLAERKLVERAKGLLMKSRGLDENAAYGALRKLAMDRKQRMGDVAQQLLDASELLNGA